MRTLEISGLSVYLREYGPAGCRPILLLHGLYADSSSMVPLAALLAGGWHVVTPDLLGHGRTVRPAEFTLRDSARLVIGLARNLGDGPAVLIGISMGAYIAAQAAIEDPARVSHLILVAARSHGAASASAALAARLWIRHPAADAAEMAALIGDALWSPATGPSRRVEPPYAGGGTPAALTAPERAAIDRSLEWFDLRPGLRAVTARTLVISGRDDVVNPPDVGAELARHIPGARFRVYDRAGHMLYLEHVDRLAADIMRFVAG